MRRLARVLLCSALAAASAAAHAAETREVGPWLARVGERVSAYFARAQSIVCEETVRLEPLGRDLMPNGAHARTVVYQLHMEWTPGDDGDGGGPTATVVRQLLTVDGRPPRPGDRPTCDGQPESGDPLMMLLPGYQGDYLFTWRGEGRERGRASVVLDYRDATKHPEAVTASFRGDCAQFSTSGHMRGRVWLDASTAEVLRWDEELAVPYAVAIPRTPKGRELSSASSFTVERQDSSYSYRPVTFRDPDETILLPATLVTLQ
ncbi:MAG: hypothetical protein ABUS56_05670, partial [Acidobacteriota bacterium]